MFETFAALYFVTWTVLLCNSVRRVDARLRSGAEFRAAVFLLEMRRNG